MKRLLGLSFLVIALTTAALWSPGVATATPLTIDDPCMMTMTAPGPEKPAAAISPPEGVFFRPDLEKRSYTGSARHLIWLPLAEKADVRTTATYGHRRNNVVPATANWGQPVKESPLRI